MTREEEFEALLEQYEPAMRRIAAVYAGAEDETEDLYQEILLQAWRSLPSFEGRSSAGTWLYRVALNTGLTWRRTVGNRKTLRDRVEQRETLTRRDTPPARRTQKKVLSEFLDLLTGPDRWVLLLYMEGLKYSEIAEVTGLSESAVGVRIHRMKDAFTQRYLEP